MKMASKQEKNILKLSVAFCILILTFSFFTGIAKRSIEVIQYPLTTALEGISTVPSHQGLDWQPSGQFVPFAKVINTL
jgi:hypothetical protein